MPPIDTGMTTSDTARPDTLRAFTLDETAARLAVTKRQAYRLLARGELRAVRVGHRQRVPESELRRLLGETEAPPE